MQATTRQASDIVPALRGGAYALRTRLTALAGWLKAELLALRTERELRELSDHMLRDVGLRRDQVASISREAGRR